MAVAAFPTARSSRRPGRTRRGSAQCVTVTPELVTVTVIAPGAEYRYRVHVAAIPRDPSNIAGPFAYVPLTESATVNTGDSPVAARYRTEVMTTSSEFAGGLKLAVVTDALAFPAATTTEEVEVDGDAPGFPRRLPRPAGWSRTPAGISTRCR